MLQPKLNLRVSQRQVLTPGLVQMVSVLALNKLELKEMINTEMVENPVLEEVEESGATIEEMAGREAERERSAEEIASEHERVEKDPFDEIDFGSYFQDYLDLDSVLRPPLKSTTCPRSRTFYPNRVL